MIIAWWSVAWAATVSGRVAERGTNAPIAEVELRVADGDLEIPVSADGRFTVELADGVEHLLLAQSPDHLVVAIRVTPPVKKDLRIWLFPAPRNGEIIVEAFRPTADLTRHKVDAEMAYETPGTYDDAVRLVQALPGVNVQREYSPTSGEVSVRGSLPGDNRYYYDGIEVPYLYHFNQYASVFPASSLDSLELFSSTFGARYGDATGAVVEATSDTDRPKDVTGSVGLNFVTVSADVKAPLPKGWWIRAGARRSFQDLVGERTTQYPLWPTFYDFNVRAEHGDHHRGTGIFAFGAGDRYRRAVGELDVLDPVEQQEAPQLDYGRNYQGLGVRHRWARGRLVSAILHDRLRGEVNVGGEQVQRSLSLPTRLDATVPLPFGMSLEAGGEVRPEVSWIGLADARRFGPLVVREAPAAAWGVDTDARLGRLRAAAYATLVAPVGPLRFQPGLRVGFDSLGLAGTIEPRFALRARLARQTELRIATGRYQQRPETVELVGSRALPTSDGWQVGAGIDQTIAGRLELSAEGYYKAQRDVLFQPFTGPPEVFSAGRAFGAELTMRYRMRETFFLWGSLAYGRSLVRDGDEAWTPTSADQPWSGGVVASWNVTRRLNLAVRYRAASGLPYTTIDGSVYDATNDTWLPRYGETNNARLPFYHKIDLHVAYTFMFPRWSLQLSADVWIVPRSSAQLYPIWSYNYEEQGFVIGPTVVPLLGLRATF